MIRIEETQQENPKIKVKVVGIGGGGCNVIDYMNRRGLKYVELIAINTDHAALENIGANEHIRIGDGTGVGGKPEEGRKAMEEALQNEEILKKLFDDTNLLILVATLGGGTGSGGIPVLAKTAKEKGTLTIGIVTKPFDFEGNLRKQRASEAIRELAKYVNTLIVIDDQKILDIERERRGEEAKKMDYKTAFHKADEILYKAIKGITNIIYKTGYVNVDFSDLRTVIENGGKAIMATGFGKGENALEEAIKDALEHPLLRENISNLNPKYLLINVVGKEGFVSLTDLQENIKDITARTGIQKFEEENIEVFIGLSSLADSPEIDYDVEVTIIATSGRPQNLKEEERGREREKRKIAERKEEKHTIVEAFDGIPLSELEDKPVFSDDPFEKGFDEGFDVDFFKKLPKRS